MAADCEKEILLVEDSENDIILTARAIERVKILNKLVVARDGVEALDYLFGTGSWKGRDLSRMPEVILLDLKLPRIDGLELLRRIRCDPRTGLLPVIVLTSSNEERDLVASYRLGANSYIRKPVSFSHFVEAVRQLGLYWLVLNEPPPPPRTSETG